MKNQSLCGLKNFGSSCWLNSSIQCFLSSEICSSYFINNDIKKYLNGDTIISIQLIKLLIGMAEENCIISPLSLFKSIIISANKNGYIFNFAQQNDAQEFLLFFIDSLHEEVKHRVNITVSGKILNNSDKVAYDAMNYGKIILKIVIPKVIDIFYGQLVTHTNVIDKDINSYSYSPIYAYSVFLILIMKKRIYLNHLIYSVSHRYWMVIINGNMRRIINYIV